MSDTTQRMRDEAEILMRDRGRIGVPTQPENGPEPGPSAYVYGDEIAVGFEWLSPDDVTVIEGAQAVPVNDAVIRVSLDEHIRPDYRFQLTQRHGEDLSPAPEFSVVGEPRRGLTAQRASLRRVTGGGIG